jgi:hypothetical protein
VTEPNGASTRGNSFAVPLAALGWFSVLLQCVLSVASAIRHGGTVGSGLVNLLGYFTILTNLLVCVSLTLPLAAAASRLGKFFARPDAVTGVATSIVFVGISYHMLLRNVGNPQGWDLFANLLLHYVMPILYLAYWWFHYSRAPLRWVAPVIWGVYPTLYLVYALLRGRLIGRYPYSFIDAGVIGYEKTVINGFGLLFVFIVLGLTLVALSRVRLMMAPSSSLPADTT